MPVIPSLRSGRRLSPSHSLGTRSAKDLFLYRERFLGPPALGMTRGERFLGPPALGMTRGERFLGPPALGMTATS
jgi:hypothetical protein